MRKHHSSKATMPAAILKCLIRWLLVDPIRWLYSSFCQLLRCCSCPNNLRTTHRPSSEWPSSLYYLHGDWVVHERQSLQLCAVHTINNLLQLTTKHHTITTSTDDHACNNLSWLCGPWTMPPTMLPVPATQAELDQIACDLTQAEDSLLGRRQHQDSWWRRQFYGCCCELCYWSGSNHRTVYYGNYSFETLEVALQHRHVSLEWFHIHTNLADALRVPTGIVVGFIINHVIDDDSLSRSVLKKCCDDPARHWFAISRVRRRDCVNDDTNDNDASNFRNNNIEAPEEDRWKILDSDRTDDATLLRPDQLQEYLQQLSTQDATIFRATLVLP